MGQLESSMLVHFANHTPLVHFARTCGQAFSGKVAKEVLGRLCQFKGSWFLFLASFCFLSPLRKIQLSQTYKYFCVTLVLMKGMAERLSGLEGEREQFITRPGSGWGVELVGKSSKKNLMENGFLSNRNFLCSSKKNTHTL